MNQPSMPGEQNTIRFRQTAGLFDDALGVVGTASIFAAVAATVALFTSGFVNWAAIAISSLSAVVAITSLYQVFSLVRRFGLRPTQRILVLDPELGKATLTTASGKILQSCEFAGNNLVMESWLLEWELADPPKVESKDVLVQRGFANYQSERAELGGEARLKWERKCGWNIVRIESDSTKVMVEVCVNQREHEDQLILLGLGFESFTSVEGKRKRVWPLVNVPRASSSMLKPILPKA